jgi:methylated-DNA-[protein]-cysteine S-methyltransferase
MTAARPERLTLATMATPVGSILLVTDEREVLRALWFDNEPEAAAKLRQTMRHHYGPVLLEPGDVPAGLRAHLDAYFRGDLAALAHIPWASHGTPFQQQVWRALTLVPAGTTTSYGALAAGIGRPKAVRAVGAANGANPIAIVVPCHRVIGANRSLTGYGGGLDAKRWLLTHEGALSPEPAAAI